MTELTGRCFCGAVRWRAVGPVLWAAHCHCEDCRRAASSDYVSWLGASRAGVMWEGPRQFHRSSPGVTRSFCATCGAAMSYESDAFPSETHLYAATMDQPDQYQPTAHLFWSERLPWVAPQDNLPRHAKGSPDGPSAPQGEADRQADKGV